MINWKKTVGFLLIVVSIVFLALTIIGISENIAHSGSTMDRTVAAGKITSYRPPFYAHGLVMILFGIFSVISFLGGITMIALSKK